MLDRLKLAGALLGLTLVLGCPKAPVEQSVVAESAVWPPPPSPAVIRSIDVITDSEWSEPVAGMQRFAATLLGKQTGGTPFKKPYDVAVDPKGRVFVSDNGWGFVFVFDKAGGSFDVLGDSGDGMLRQPAGVATDARGHIYVADTMGERVVEYDPDLRYVHAYGSADHVVKPSDVAIVEDRNELWVVDTGAHAIHVFERGGDYKLTHGVRGERNGEFNFPTQITISDETAYIVDTMNFRIQALDLDGNYLRQWGGNCNRLGCFQRPKGIAHDSEGHLYVVDAAFQNVQIFDPAGRLLLIFGEPSGPARLNLPAGIGIGDDDKIFVASQYSWSVSVFEFLGTPELQPGAEDAAMTPEPSAEGDSIYGTQQGAPESPETPDESAVDSPADSPDESTQTPTEDEQTATPTEVVEQPPTDEPGGEK